MKMKQRRLASFSKVALLLAYCTSAIVARSYCKARSLGNGYLIDAATTYFVNEHENVPVNSEVRYICHRGYYLYGGTEYDECQGDGSWSAKNIPVCLTKEQYRSRCFRENGVAHFKFDDSLIISQHYGICHKKKSKKQNRYTVTIVVIVVVGLTLLTILVLFILQVRSGILHGEAYCEKHARSPLKVYTNELDSDLVGRGSISRDELIEMSCEIPLIHHEDTEYKVNPGEVSSRQCRHWAFENRSTPCQKLAKDGNTFIKDELLGNPMPPCRPLSTPQAVTPMNRICNNRMPCPIEVLPKSSSAKSKNVSYDKDFATMSCGEEVCTPDLLSMPSYDEAIELLSGTTMGGEIPEKL